ncbi:hypothetical protein CXB51_013702 [Gossypium anomalum]|uniref:Uncharacterized protein n=1 Tax=Gossypium anomalum TaxID=47600 RepID=A0A8J6D402_9ROSI|nr:hypothetical protein CXB51_013702 [Gossypium anomalum]
MEVESGESNPRKGTTFKAVKERAEKRGNRISSGVIVKYFDNTDAPYDWFLPGWIVEECFVSSDYKGRERIYKNNYDSIGHLYHGKCQVFFAWEKLNIIFHDGTKFSSTIQPESNQSYGASMLSKYFTMTPGEILLSLFSAFSFTAYKVASVNGGYSLACCCCAISSTAGGLSHFLFLGLDSPLSTSISALKPTMLIDNSTTESPLTLATFKAVKERVEKRGNRISSGVIVKYFDNTDAPYDWLLPGWIVEECFVPSNYKGRERIYKGFSLKHDEGNNAGLIYLIDLVATLIIRRNKSLLNNLTREQPVIRSIDYFTMTPGEILLPLFSALSFTACKVASVNGGYSLACGCCAVSSTAGGLSHFLFLELDSPLSTSISALKPTMLIVLAQWWRWRVVSRARGKEMGETTSSSSRLRTTFKAVKERVEKRGNRISSGVIVKYFDNTDAPYDWLLPGWIVKERFVPSNYIGRERIYKIIMMMMMIVQKNYDPIGHLYHGKCQVFFAWEKLNIIFHDGIKRSSTIQPGSNQSYGASMLSKYFTMTPGEILLPLFSALSFTACKVASVNSGYSLAYCYCAVSTTAGGLSHFLFLRLESPLFTSISALKPTMLIVLYEPSLFSSFI